MLPRFARGKFFPKNREKYIGLKTPTYRSSWEQAFMRLCDEHPYVAKWASESIKIPYRHPFTGKYTVYVPDFFIVFSGLNNFVNDVSEGMTELKKKYSNQHPTNITTLNVKNSEDENDFLSYGNSAKNLYLVLQDH